MRSVAQTRARRTNRCLQDRGREHRGAHLVDGAVANDRFVGLQSLLAQSGVEALEAVGGEIALERCAHEADPCVPKGREMRHGGREGRGAVRIEIRIGAALVHAAMEHEGKSAVEEIGDPLIVDIGARDDHRVDPFVLHEPLQGAHLGRARFRRRDEEIEIRRREPLPDRSDQFDEEGIVEMSRSRRQNHADGFDTAHRQLPGRCARRVAIAGRRLTHALPRHGD